MCVAVTLDPGATLTKQEVVAMDKNNADGAGVAWAREGLVEWYKTTKVDPDYIVRAINNAKDHSRLVHFRLSTAGGVRPELCHPFEISPRAECKPRHVTNRAMIHNGHWGRWDDLHKILKRDGLLPDDGPWSDTRLVAFMAHEDPSWLDAIGGKVAVMDGTGRIERIGDWDKLRDGIHVSNLYWRTATYTRGGYSGYRHWPGWEFSDEEWKAFIKEQADAREAEANKLMADIEAEHKRNHATNSKRRETNAEKRERKRDERRQAKREAAAGAGDAGNAGNTDDGADSGDCCQLPLPKPVRAQTTEVLADLGDCTPTDLNRIEASAVHGKPVQVSSGRWYQVVEKRGAREVVEVFPVA